MHFDFDEYSGIKYFWHNLEVMWEFCTLPTRIMIVAYFLLLAYVCVKGTKKEKCFFVVSFFVLVIGCYNPWMAWILATKWRFMERYFRLFWILPITIGFVYYGIKYYDSMKSKKKIIVLWLVLIVFFFFSAYLVCKETAFQDIYTGDEVNTGMVMVDNIYKVEDEIIELSDLIEKDSGDPFQTKNALYNRDVFIELRAYDSAINPVVPYASFGDYNFNDSLSESDWFALMTIFFTGKTDGVDEETVTSDLLKNTMANVDCDYVILPNSNHYYDLWTESFDNLGVVGRYTVLKVR